MSSSSDEETLIKAISSGAPPQTSRPRSRMPLKAAFKSLGITKVAVYDSPGNGGDGDGVSLLANEAHAPQCCTMM